MNNLTYIERNLTRMTSSGAAANTQTFNLPREHLYNRLFLRAYLGATTTNAYTANAEDLVVSNIEVIANGQLVVKSFSWADLVNINKYVNGVADVDRIALAADKTEGMTSCIVDFSLTRKDLSTMLPSFKFTTLDLKLSFAAQTTYGGDVGVMPYVDVMSRELLYVKEFQDIKFAINKEVTKTISPAATGEKQIDLDIGNVYRRIYVYGQGGATAATAQNDTMTSLSVVQDGVIFHKKLTFLENQAKDKQEYHLETKVTGVTMLGFDMEGSNLASVDSAPFSSWRVLVTIPSVSNAVSVRIIPQELIYPRG